MQTLGKQKPPCSGISETHGVDFSFPRGKLLKVYVYESEKAGCDLLSATCK